MARDPICGMYVEEKLDSLSHKIEGSHYYFCSSGCMEEFISPEKELQRLKKHVVVSVILTATIFVVMFLLPLDHQINHYLLFITSIPLQFWIGFRFYQGTYDAFKHKMTNMDVLIVLGTTTAWGYSTIITFFPEFFPADKVYFDTSAMIITLMLIGRLLENSTKAKASKSIRGLFDLRPQKARVIRGEIEQEIPVEQVKLNEIVIVKPGEKIPVDGLVIEGNSSVNQSIITGESVPIPKSAGDEVIGATMNEDGIIKLKVTKVGVDTVFSQIMKLVESAKSSKVPIQRLADKVSSYFVPIIAVIAVISGISWFFVGGIGIAFSILAFISVIIISCPCALGIATPAALTVGAGKAAENGILIKGGENLENARKIQILAFDKTGTLTKGTMSVTDIVSFGEFDKNEILRLAAVSEKGSEHPLGKAIVNHAREKLQIGVSDADFFKNIPGLGISSQVGIHKILIGSTKFIEENHISVENDAKIQLQKMQEQGKTSLLVAIDGKVSGLIAMMDTEKDFASEVIEKLNKFGIETIMLTGDSKTTAQAIAKKIGISKVIADVLPNQKESEIRKLKRQGKVVAMVGDGINDAPALASADLGIALGSGTDVAKETGGIILVKDDLRDVLTAIELSRKTMSKIKQNLFWAFAYNAALIPIAAGILVPVFGAEMYEVLPILAATAMATSSATVVGNSLLLRKYQPELASN